MSQDAKQHAQDQLKVLDADTFDYESQVPDEQQKNTNNVAGGLKAYVLSHHILASALPLMSIASATNNPNVSEAGKEAAEKKLQGL